MYWLWRDRLRRKLRSSSYSRQNRSAAPCSLKPHIHRIRSLDPAMVLFKAIVEVDIRPVTDLAAQRGTDCPWVGVVPISGYPVRHKASNRPCRAEEPFRRPHVTGRTQHRVNQVPVAIDRPIQVAPLTVDLQVGVSRPKEFHLRPLSEPDRNLSAHPAPIIPPMPRTQACHKACGSSRIPPGCPVDPPRPPDDAAPSLPRHYSGLNATTSGSVPWRRIATVGLAFLGAASMPDAIWPASRCRPD